MNSLPAISDYDAILNVDLAVALIKKLSFFLFIYSFGYFGFSIVWPFAVIIFLILNAKWKKEKDAKLEIARAMALGFEKDILVNALEELPSWIKFSEFEKVEWLNSIFKLLWQNVNNYAEELVPKILEPAIQGYASDFKFNHVVLGNVPLRVDGVKVYDHTDERKIVIDLDISYKGDCYVTFQTFKFTGGIKDIQLQGRLRVVLTPLIAKSPLIGGLQAYFMNPPNVDFDLIKVTQILDIPGVRSKIKNTTLNIINSMFLYPNAYSINLSQGVNVSRLAVFRTEGILRIHVVEAKNLVNKDIIGKSDPYVVLKVGSIRVETPVIQNSLNPKWDFWHEFEIESNSELKIEVWDQDDGSKDDTLGHCRADIAQVAKIRQNDMWIPLQGVAKGTIHIRLTWLSLSSDYSDLEAAYKETQLLSPHLHTAFLMIYLESSLLNYPYKTHPSPFVELTVEQQTKRTEVEKDTCQPIWDKCFTFLIQDPREALLILKVHDENTNSTIGELDYALDDLQKEAKLSLRNHTLLFKKPSNSEASIRCTLMLRILRNDYVEEKSEESEPKKMLKKQESSVSNKSMISQNSNVTSESGQSEHEFTDDEVSELGQIKLSLSYSQQRQRLIVNVQEANITSKHSHPPDSYVRLILQTEKIKNNKKKTKTMKNTLNPTFNEEFDYLISGQDLNFSTLTVELKSEGLFGRKKFLGRTVIALTKCNGLDKPFTDWFNLNSKGDAHVYHLLK